MTMLPEAMAPLRAGAAAGAAHEVPIHPYVPAAGACASAALAAFAAVVVFMPPGPVNEAGTLKYVSEGMREHCGWSGLVMGTAGAVIGLCELLPAVHVARGDMVLCVFVQLVGWNVVLGVVDTGWALHYVALALFCAADVAFHYVMSRTPAYGHALYRTVHAGSAAALAVFVGAFVLVQALAGAGHDAARNVAVLLEFVLVGSFTANTLCLMWSLNSYSSIRVRFTCAPAPDPAWL